MTDSQLRELYALALAARAGGGRGHCATPEAILALVRREGEEVQRLATLDHVMACDACGREFELLRAIDRAGAESGAADTGERTAPAQPTAAVDVTAFRPRARRWRRFGAIALAASVLLVAGVGVLYRARGPGGDEVMRGEQTGVTLLAPPTEVRAGTPVTFVWRPLPDATRYELELLDATGAVVLATTTQDTTARITGTDARRLVPGAEYRWWVRAADGGGVQRTSPLRRLRVRRE